DYYCQVWDSYSVLF
nr:immunoglobulin light chain junction region [Macaca mulatta]MOW29672.1 immunoglobulin light chain junction region [Macaca mulatta]